MYLAWFDSALHVVNFTRSNGIFLWSRTMSFANCSVIKPPADEAALCPPSGHRLGASSYIWVPQSPLNKIPGGRFTAKKNSLAQNFALRAIAAQPAGYAASRVARLHAELLLEPAAAPEPRTRRTSTSSRWRSACGCRPAWRTPGGGTLSGDQRAYAGAASNATKAYEPYAGFMRGYQRFVYLRGTLLGIILLIGFAAIVRSWLGGGIRRLRDWGGPALLPWLTAVVLLLMPVATADFDLRYVVPAVPVACLAAALAFARAPPAPMPRDPRCRWHRRRRQRDRRHRHRPASNRSRSGSRQRRLSRCSAGPAATPLTVSSSSRLQQATVKRATIELATRGPPSGGPPSSGPRSATPPSGARSAANARNCR